MKWFFVKDKSSKENEQEDNIPPFKSFNSTYKWITGILGCAMMYPNPKTDTWRLIAIPIVIATAVPYLLMTTSDIYEFLLARDLANLIRLSTVIGPFTCGFLKMIMMYLKRRQAEMIVDEIARDYEIQNHATQRIRKAVYQNIRSNIIYERFWVICVFICVTIFPIQPAVKNVYSYMMEGEARYMITELRNPFAKSEDIFSSPYFEIMFIYNMYCCFLYFLYFTGYDCFMLVSIGHACLKFQLFTMTLEHAMTVSDVGERRKMFAAVVKEQVRTIWFVNLIQKFFSIWFNLLIAAILAQICSCLFYILEGFGMDERYAIFTVSTVIYLYLLCSRASQLKATGEATPTKLYCCGWEHVQDEEIRRVLPFMIARFQQPFVMQAYGFFVFDMELFVTIMKTAYSMFTLLKK